MFVISLAAMGVVVARCASTEASDVSNLKTGWTFLSDRDSTGMNLCREEFEI